MISNAAKEEHVAKVKFDFHWLLLKVACSVLNFKVKVIKFNVMGVFKYCRLLLTRIINYLKMCGSLTFLRWVQSRQLDLHNPGNNRNHS